MASQRKIIRAAIVQALKNANIVGSSVYPNRWLPTWQTELPAIFVYTEDEDSQVFNEAPREYRRVTRVITEIIASADQALDDTLDDLSDKIETAITADVLFGQSCDDTYLKGTKLEMFSDGDALMGSLQISWDVLYYKQMPGDLSGALPFFSKAVIKVDQTPQDGNIDIESNQVLDPFINAQSLLFDGTKVISIPSKSSKASPPFALGKSATFSAWIKPTDLTQARTLFSCFDFGIFSGFEIGIGLSTLGQLGFVSGSTVVTPVSEDTGTPIPINKWTHIAVTFDGAHVSFYKNGVLSSTVARTALIGKSDTPLFLGADTNKPSNRPFIGNINNFSIWNNVFTAAQILELAASGHPADLKLHSAFANGIGWWRMIGPSDTINQIQDEFGNNNGAAMNVLSTDFVSDVP